MEAYFLKVNVALALFYAFYRLFFYRDTFFMWRRAALLSFFGMAALVPLLNVGTWMAAQEPMVAMADLYAAVILPELTVGGGETTPTDWQGLLSTGLFLLYVGVAALLFVRFLVRLASILRLGGRCPSAQVQGVRVRLLPTEAAPFSFFGWIFVHPDCHTGQELGEILTHEQAHVRQAHSVDVIIGELACILCWMNPFVWLLRREIRTNLEFLADERVLAHGYARKSYQYHLLALTYHKAAANLSNNFNVLPLKKRITMMNKKRTSEISKAKYLLFLPLAALLMVACNIDKAAKEKAASEQVSNEPVLKEEVAPEQTSNEPVFEDVEQMPEFLEGGMPGLIKYLGDNIRYPKDAQDRKIEGRVIARFVVEKDGSIADVEILRSVDASLDAEAVRVLSGMPKWKPGMQDGKAVRVKFTVPVMFKLK